MICSNPYYNYPYYSYPYYNYPYSYEVPVEVPVEVPTFITENPKNIQISRVSSTVNDGSQGDQGNQGSKIDTTTTILIVLGSLIFVGVCVYLYNSHKNRNRRISMKSEYLPFTRAGN